MAIKRTYTTKEECVRYYYETQFDRFPAWVVTESESMWERFAYFGLVEYEEGSEYEYVGEPMWSTWWIPRDMCLKRFINENPQKVMDCGFTVIYSDEDENEVFALGIDGAGYDFIGTHFTRLYDAEGLTWHDED